jgi:hypothetical protein
MFNWLKNLFKGKEENDYEMIWSKTLLGDDLEIGDCFYFDENGIIRKTFTERKEMELLSGRKYENKEIGGSFVFITGFKGDSVFYTSPLSSEKMILTNSQFREIYKEWHEPLQLKLEDLNKHWVLKSVPGSIYKITNIYSNHIYAVSIANFKVEDFGNINEFFRDYREATQTDIDNLTKGE